MKIAITSKGNDLDALLDNRFGKCSNLVFYDLINRELEIIPNPHRETEDESGNKTVELVESRNVTKVISGEFGMQIKPLMDKHRIQMILLRNTDITIRRIIEMISDTHSRSTDMIKNKKIRR